MQEELMNKRFYPFTAYLVLVIVSIACASPLGDGGVATTCPDEVATVVALTTANYGSATPQSQAGLLPHTLYYLSNGSGGTMQVFRIEKDGKTVHQVTTEPNDVGPYDVSQVDGRVAV